MKQTDENIVIGDTTDKCYKDNLVATNKYSIESPYLPPNTNEEETIFKRYPIEIQTFISTHSPLITANAFTLSFYQGKDLYGLDMCVELIKNLKSEYPNIGLLFALAKKGNKTQKTYLDQVQKTILELDLEKNICIFTNKNEIWPLIKKSDLFVRPTLSDGHSLSVQEANDLNIPVIASNVCLRPKTSILFENENILDFIGKTKTSLNDLGTP
jgi:glycosyltransferase involved in cell wall biosynthesis